MAHTLDSGVHASADGTTAMHVPTLSTVHVLHLVLSFSLVVISLYFDRGLVYTGHVRILSGVEGWLNGFFYQESRSRFDKA